jgi:predicted AAA+ superfamily ATPase
MIQRLLKPVIEDKLFKNKAIVIIGARQTGKTTLLKTIAANYDKVLWINADNIEDRELFDKPSSTRLKAIVGSHKIVVIDEAQRIQDIGIKLKLITDELPEIQLIVSGSSAFELSGKINESLTGRKFELKLYPLSFTELVNHTDLFTEIKMLNHRLVYGSYPDVINNPGDEKEILQELTNSYLYKDILEWNRIKKANKIVKLLQAIAFQVGNQVSYHELGQITGLNSETVESYITLLEQSFVIFTLSSFSRNLRNELKKSKKIYFYDNGIRNTLIANYNPVELRNDTGALWENYLISERIKYTSYQKIYGNRYFWRTLTGQEIDFIEEREGKLFAYEFKWNPNKKVKTPSAFANAYPDYHFEVITPKNYESFIY